jgi:hypothetical protein
VDCGSSRCDFLAAILIGRAQANDQEMDAGFSWRLRDAGATTHRAASTSRGVPAKWFGEKTGPAENLD